MKRFFSLTVCVVLILCSFSSALAVPPKRDPIIYVVGYMSGTLVKNAGTPEEADILPPDAKTLAKAIMSAVPAYSAFRLTRDYKDFANAICDACEMIFDEIRFDDSGNSVYRVSQKNENIVTDEQPYGKCNYFYYDWRMDVTETADQLNDYIHAVLEKTGSDKVALLCSSMGGCVGSAYLVKYGSDQLSSMILSSSAAMGVEAMSDLLCGNLDLEYEPIYSYLVSLDLLSNLDLSESTLKIINTFGFDTILSDIASTLSQNEDIFYERMIVPYFAKFPGVWSFVKSNRIDECKKAAKIVGGSALDKKINHYLLDVRPMIIPSLFYAKENAVKLAILSGYNTGAVPVLSNQTYQSDNLIATSDTSFGAICTDLNRTFPNDYEQYSDTCHYHVSPDKIIDASACAFPDNTWFMKDAPHPSFDPRFIYWVAYTEGEVNVYSNENYPQFLQFHENTVTPIAYESDGFLASYQSKIRTAVFKILELFQVIKSVFS